MQPQSNYGNALLLLVTAQSCVFCACSNTHRHTHVHTCAHTIHTHWFHRYTWLSHWTILVSFSGIFILIEEILRGSFELVFFCCIFWVPRATWIHIRWSHRHKATVKSGSKTGHYLIIIIFQWRIQWQDYCFSYLNCILGRLLLFFGNMKDFPAQMSQTPGVSGLFLYEHKMVHLHYCDHWCTSTSAACSPIGRATRVRWIFQVCACVCVCVCVLTTCSLYLVFLCICSSRIRPLCSVISAVLDKFNINCQTKGCTRRSSDFWT